jgi:hypothetical protein
LKALDWFKQAWNQLQEEYRNGEFTPQNERDIQAHLYHHLLLRKPDDRTIPTEYSLKLNDNKTKHIDLAILKKANQQIRLLIEIKEMRVKTETSKKANLQQVLKRIQKDIHKMQTALEVKGTSHSRKPIQVFFFRGIKEITRELDNQLTEEAKRIWKEQKNATIR